jgi:hypothetical protein
MREILNVLVDKIESLAVCEDAIERALVQKGIITPGEIDRLASVRKDALADLRVAIYSLPQ